MFELREVRNKRDVEAFHLVQDIVYQGDPEFIKPIIQDIEDIFDPKKNDYFNGGEAQRFILYRDEEPIGRTAVFFNTKPNGQRIGGMGFFECLPQKDAAFKLFDTCRDWLLARELQYMDGPVNFGDRDSFWGLLISSKSYPSYRENYHPRYYKQFFEEYGFVTEIEQSTYEITHSLFDYDRFNTLAGRVRSNPAYEFKFMDYGQVEKFATDFVEIYNKAWSFHEDFKPLTLDRIRKLLKTFKPVMPPELAVFAYAHGKPAGFYVNILEINQVLKDFNGKLGWWNGLRLLWRRRKINKARGIIFGVIPEFHNLGLESGMIMKFREGILKHKQLAINELAWIGDFNRKMFGLLEKLGAVQTKTHVTYRKFFE